MSTSVLKPSLSMIPCVLLVKITSFLSFQQKHVVVLALINRTLSAALKSRVFWQVLSKSTWARDELYSQLPALSPPSLYSILEKYSPLEGFFTLLTAFPWCLLCVFRFSEGKFIGEAIRFDAQANARRASSSMSPSRKRALDEAKAAAEVRIPLLDITFQENRGEVQETCTLHADPSFPVILQKGLPSVPLSLQLARGLFDESSTVCPGYVDAREGISIMPQPRPEVEPPAVGWWDWGGDMVGKCVQFAGTLPIPTWRGLERGFSGPNRLRTSLAISADDAWAPEFVQEGDTDPLTTQTNTMILSLLREHGLAFGLLAGAGDERLVPRLASTLRQGLYVGNYGRSFYGQFKHEVLRLSYVTFAGEDLEARIATVFVRIGQTPHTGLLPGPLAAALKDWQRSRTPGTGVSLLVVKKVTGDAHVCAGATTFVAVCAPQDLVDRLALQQDTTCQPPPSEIRCNSNNDEVTILEAWRGWGTLAFAGLRNPSWNPGWLLGCQDGRFGQRGERSREISGENLAH